MSLSKAKKVCILCNGPLLFLQEKRDDDNRQTFIQIMYTEILGMDNCRWLAQYSSYPVCAECAEPIDQLCETRQKFKIYEYQYEKLKEKLVKMLVLAYCDRKKEYYPSNRLMEQFCQRKDVIDSLCEEWKSNFMTPEAAEPENLTLPEIAGDSGEGEEFIENNDGPLSPHEDSPSPMEEVTCSNSNPVVSEEELKFTSMSENESSENSFEMEPIQSPDAYINPGNMDSDFSNTLSVDSSTTVAVLTKQRKKGKSKEKPTERKKLIKQRVECSICHITTFGNNLKEHMRTHSDERPFGCPHCAATFRRKKGLTTHLRCHLISDDRIYFCHKCEDPLKTKLMFLKHLHHPNHLNKDVQLGDIVWFYYCDIPTCRCSFGSEEDLRAHLRTHTPDGTFRCCNICGKAFAEECNLLSHSVSAHGDTTLWHSCKFCHLDFETSDSLRVHQDIHKIEVSISTFPYLCDLCGKSFAFEANLSHHHRRFHEGRRVYKKKKDGDPKIGIVKARPEFRKRRRTGRATQRQNSMQQKYSCPDCAKKYTTKTNLILHSYTHNPNHDGFCCEHCGKSYNLPTKLRHHVRVSHEGGYPKKLKCNYCTEYFPFALTLRQHMVRKHAEAHLQVKSHYCPACWHCFMSQEELTVHFVSTHPKNKCNFCEKQFADVTRLKRHLVIHTGEKPFVCDYCGKKFSQDTYYKEHLVTHTGDRPNKCRFCSSGFLRRKQLIAHMQKMHNQAIVEQPCDTDATE